MSFTSKPNFEFDKDKKSFSLISKDVFDVNKPLNSSSLHDYNKTENSTILTNDVKASINTNELTINKK